MGKSLTPWIGVVLVTAHLGGCRFGYELFAPSSDAPSSPVTEPTETGGTSGASSGGTGQGGAAGGSSGGAGAPAMGGTPSVSLVHRYSFNGNGAIAEDSIGNADGTIVGGLMSGGALTLAGGSSDEYVDLPNGIVSALDATTMEAWVHWDGHLGNEWQRVFDFGDNTGGEDGQGLGITSFSYTSDVMWGRTLFDVNPDTVSDGWRVHWADPLPSGRVVHVAVTFSDEPGNQRIVTYLDGVVVGDPIAVPDGEGLSQINDVNNWLGRAQWEADAEFDGIFYEFRIYQRALSEDEIAESFAAGPEEPVFF